MHIVAIAEGRSVKIAGIIPGTLTAESAAGELTLDPQIPEIERTGFVYWGGAYREVQAIHRTAAGVQIELFPWSRPRNAFY